MGGAAGVSVQMYATVPIHSRVCVRFWAAPSIDYNIIAHASEMSLKLASHTVANSWLYLCGDHKPFVPLFGVTNSAVQHMINLLEHYNNRLPRSVHSCTICYSGHKSFLYIVSFCRKCEYISLRKPTKIGSGCHFARVQTFHCTFFMSFDAKHFRVRFRYVSRFVSTN